MSIHQFFNTVQDIKVNFKKFDSFERFNVQYDFRENSINIIHINIGSIKKYWLSLLVYLQDIIQLLDVIVLTEINIRDDESVNFNLDNFESFFRCRIKGNGGGIAVFVRDKFVVTRLFFDLEESEHLCLKLKHFKFDFETILSSIYRPPDKRKNIFIDQLNLFLSNYLVKNSNVIVIGDINICTISKSKDAIEYVNTLSGNGLCNSIKDFTREEITNGELKKSCLDHVNVKAKKWNQVESFLIRSKLKDHYFVGCSLLMKAETKKLSRLKNTKTFKTVILKSIVNEEISKVDWDKIGEVNDPELLYKKIKYEFDKIYEKARKDIEINELDKVKPWVNDKIKKLIKEKETIFNRWKQDKSNEALKNSYKICRNRVTALVRKQYSEYFKHRFSEHSGDMPKTWKIIDEVLGKKKKTVVFMKL